MSARERDVRAVHRRPPARERCVPQHEQGGPVSRFDGEFEPCDVVAIKLGCLARTDGAIPWVRGATTTRGVPAPVVENWQQAVGVVRVWPDGSWLHDTVMIRDGWAFYDGHEFTAERHSTPIAA